MTGSSVQDLYSPAGRCFGCGPANPDGLQLKSFPEGERLIAQWQPAERHQAFPGMLNGGVIGTLLDCHSNWTAAWHLMQQAQLTRPLCTVTAAYAVKLLRPTALDVPVEIVSRVTQSSADRAEVEATLSSQGRICATCRGTFVAVRPGHPAYHQW